LKNPSDLKLISFENNSSLIKIETPADRDALISLIYMKDHLEDFRSTLDILKYPRHVASSIIDLQRHINDPSVNYAVKQVISKNLNDISTKLDRLKY
jgi:hypothetical protein